MLWQTYMIAEKPKIVGKNATGTPLWKPAGVGVWSTPTIDTAKNTVYVGTGNSYTSPAAPMSDSDRRARHGHRRHPLVQPDHGERLVRRRLQGRRTRTVPPQVGPDHDFGSSPILRTVGGRRILLAGQKSGVMFALDPDNNGKVLWQQKVGKGSELGGIEWGPAADCRACLRRRLRRHPAGRLA